MPIVIFEGLEKVAFSIKACLTTHFYGIATLNLFFAESLSEPQSTRTVCGVPQWWQKSRKANTPFEILPNFFKTEEEVVYTDLLQYLLCNQRTDFANQVCLTAARGGFWGSLCFLSDPAA